MGTNGTVLKTTTAGNTWTVRSLGIIDWLRSVFFTSTATGYAVSDMGDVINTKDGGADWTVQKNWTSNYLNSVFFTDVNTE